MIAAVQPDESLPSDLAQSDTNNATFIYYQDLTGFETWDADFFPLNKKRWYQKADRYNKGEINGIWENDPYHRKKENQRIIRTFIDQLELSERQAEQAESWFHHFKLEDWHPPKEIVAYCLCAYLVHSDPNDERKCHPQTPDEKKDRYFLQMEDALRLRESTSMGKNVLDSTYGKIRFTVKDKLTPYIEPFDKYGVHEGVSGPFIRDSSKSERSG